MASTRSKNTIGNYSFEKRDNENRLLYSVYKNYAVPEETYFPGNGLIGARMTGNDLAMNSCDIESSLFGIGSNNLENPQPDVVPELKQLKYLSIIDRIPLITPAPLVVQLNQRPNLRS